ncbi:MAG TPA: TolC family protein, partial [Bacteroidales bacterium]|nr:TolC family protein [Bacteroidales bacterium]
MKTKAVLIYILLLICIYSAAGQDPGYVYNLKQLIDSALQNNYLIKANEKQSAVKQSDIELLRLTYQPTISASATASVWKFLLPNKQRLLGNSLTDVYTDISVYQTIYEWGENKVRKSAIKDEILLNEEIKRQLRSTIIWGVEDTYYEILKAESEVTVHHNTLYQLRTHLRYAEALYKIGKVSGVDVLKINVQISVEEKALQKSVNSVLAHQIKLGRLCFPERP